MTSDAQVTEAQIPEARITGARVSEAQTSRVPDRRQGGFTLLELMVALGILTFGVTSLIGVLSVGVGTRRGAEMRGRAVMLAEQALQNVQLGVLAEKAWTTLDENDDLKIDPMRVEEPEGFPGMQYVVEIDTAPEFPELVLARVRISWLDDGDAVVQEFRRVLPREAPFSSRVAARWTNE